ncbi:hypothetical protein ACFTXM_29310 [Streptomyces sp. NPDC056930]|uniref:hypothetical protein n=1 Tax=Streptomyces sp. NPDC056930 TaxID=3345967 RepID=UPI00363C9D66
MNCGLLSCYLCPNDRRGIYTSMSEDGLKLLAKARPTSEASLREALAEATRHSEPASLVTAVEAVNTSPRR